MSILDFIFPKKCVNCKRFGDFLCADCFSQIRYMDDFSSDPIGSLDQAISAVVYNKISRRLIRQFKYQPHVSKLAETISGVMNEGLAQNESFYNFISKYSPTIVPIPLSPRRLRERGYNHAEIIASHAAKYFRVKINFRILVRIKETKPQYKLNKSERRENVQGAFGIAKNAKVPNSVILIDDVATTYATLKEAAKILKRNGSKRVLGVTFAREI